MSRILSRSYEHIAIPQPCITICETGTSLSMTFFPQNGATAVEATAVPYIRFGREAALKTGTITITNITDSLTVRTYDIAIDPDLQLSGGKLQLSLLNAGLELQKDYEITMTAGAVCDLEGNDFGPINTGDWAFDTHIGDFTDEFDDDFF